MNVTVISKIDKPKRKPNAVYILSLVLVHIHVTFIYLYNEGQQKPESFRSLINCLILVLISLILKKFLAKGNRNLLSPEVVFSSVFSLFHFFYIALYSYGFAPIDPEVFWKPEKVIPATCFSMLCLLNFLFSYEIFGIFYGKIVYRNLRKNMVEVQFVIMLSRIGIYFCLILFWGFLLYSGISSLMTDYKGLISVGGRTGGRLFWLSQYLSIVFLCIYCSISGLYFGKYIKGIVTQIVTLTLILSVLFLGDRGGFIYLAIVPILSYHYYQKKISCTILIGFVLGLIALMGFIGLTRNSVVLDIGKATDVYKSRKQDQNIIVHTGLEFGTSLKTVVIAMSLIPSEHKLWYGKSYLDAFLVAIPNLIPGMARKSKGAAVWISETAFGSLKKTHGRGGSIAMEAYMNFGFWGGISIFFLIGGFYRVVYENLLCKPSIMNSVVFFSACSGMMLWVRNTSNYMPRTVLWAITICWLLFIASRSLIQQRWSCNKSGTKI